MYNWSVDTSKIKRKKEDYLIWKLEQQINFGLNGKKLSLKLLKKYWNKLEIDPKRKNVLFSWLWPEKFLQKNKKRS